MGRVGLGEHVASDYQVPSAERLQYQIGETIPNPEVSQIPRAI